MRIATAGILLALSSAAMAAEPDYAKESREVSKSFLTQLGGELKKQLAANGPEGAVKACKTIAPVIASDLSIKHGWKVARVSLKPRNPLTGTPDVWEQKVLAEFDRRAAAGEKADTMEFFEVVDEPQGKAFRYMKAVGVQPMCLTCHGPKEQMGEAIKARLGAEYPHDKGFGYSVGQIRGAVTIKRSL